MKNLRTSRLFTLAAAVVLAAGVVLPIAGCGGQAAPAASAGSDTGSAAANAAVITVNLNIDGSLGEEGAESEQVVTLPAGATVLDALEASNAQITVEEGDYGPYVTIVNGIAAHDSYGWVYDVNGETIMVGANEYELSDGDTVNWIFVSYE